jgi:hypothetical protein
MDKLIELLQIQWMQDDHRFYEKLEGQTTIRETLNDFRFDCLIPRSSQNKYWPDLDTLKGYLRGRYDKAMRKHRQGVMADLIRIDTAPTPHQIIIMVEWKKSQTWGSNPTATIDVYGERNHYESFKSRSIGGCGYDKESTAIAEALNQSDGIIKLLYQAKNDGYSEENNTNEKVLGYGSGYGILPSFAGGVGTSCFERIFQRLGYDWERTASGKTFDIWRITKKEESQK